MRYAADKTHSALYKLGKTSFPATRPTGNLLFLEGTVPVPSGRGPNSLPPVAAFLHATTHSHVSSGKPLDIAHLLLHFVISQRQGVTLPTLQKQCPNGHFFAATLVCIPSDIESSVMQRGLAPYDRKKYSLFFGLSLLSCSRIISFSIEVSQAGIVAHN